MSKDFEYLEHTADITIRVYGETLEQFFHHALVAMFQITKPRITGCKTIHNRIVCNSLPIQHNITIMALNTESLLVDFLSEALYLSDVYNEAYLDATIQQLTNTSIMATLYGAAIQGFGIEIKAITYHQLAIQNINHIWQADITFDI